MNSVQRGLAEWTNIIPSQELIAKTFAPGVHREFDSTDAEWRGIVRRYRWGTMKRAARRVALSAIGSSRASVEQRYAPRWTMDYALSSFDPEGNDGTVVWRDRCYLANMRFRKRVHLLLLMRAIDMLRPRSILEVGSGVGLNLCMLANRFPEISFTGIELTQAGVEVARKISALPALPPSVVAFSPEPLRDSTAHVRISWHQGNAASLPFESNQFDLVFTIQAIEQMQAIKDVSLREIGRVTRHVAVMFEPFAEFNRPLINRLRVIGRDQFRGTLNDLRLAGLDPVVATDEMPQKLFYGVGMVAARPTRQR